MKRRLRAALGSTALVIGTGLAAASGVLLAATPSHAEPVRSRTVEVVVRGDAREAVPLVDTLRELLGREQLTVVPEAGAVPVLARVRVDLLASGRALVEVTGRGERVLLRREMPMEGTMAREAIAHVVQEAVEVELLETQPPPASVDAGAPPAASAAPEAPAAPPTATPPPPPPAPPPPAPRAPAEERRPSSPSRFVLDVAMFGGVGPVSNGSGPVPRVGAGAEIGWASRFRPSLLATFSGAFPYDRGADLVTARASMLSGRLVPSLELGRTDHFAFEVGLGGGIDVISVQPRSEVLPATAVGASTTRVSPVGTAMLTTRIDVVSSVVFFASLAVDVDPVRRSYVIAEGPNEHDDVLSPWNVRPTLLLGFAFTAVGPPTFAQASATEGRSR